MGGRVWTLTQTEDTLWYYVYKIPECPEVEERDQIGTVAVPPQVENQTEKRFKRRLKEDAEQPVTELQGNVEDKEMLRDYFQLNVKLEDLYKQWGDADPHFRQIADIFTGQYIVCLHMHTLHRGTVIMTSPTFTILPDGIFHVSPGVRMLRQEPTECLFSFICTSNNHISRIQGMVERLCQALGTPLCQLDQAAYHDFPTLSVLAGVQFFSFLILCHFLFLFFCR